MRATRVAAAMLVAVGYGGVAHADESGWYLGVGVGQSKLSKADAESIGAQPSGVIFPDPLVDRTGEALAAVFGYRASPNFAVEMSYVDLGKVGQEATVPPAAGTVIAKASATLHEQGPAIALLGAVPLNSWSEVHIRGGMLFARAKLELRYTSDTGIGAHDVIATSQDYFYGLGVAFAAGRRWVVSVDFQKYLDVGDHDITGERDVNVLGISGLYRF